MTQPVHSQRIARLIPSHRSSVQELFDRQQARLFELQRDRSETPSGLIYHYTSDVGLYQIINAGHLWISDYTSLNDPSEISYGIGLGMKALSNEVHSRGNPTLSGFFVKSTTNLVHSNLHRFFSAYVLSMSLAPDELTQWRSYADGGAGYRLGFDSRILDQTFTKYTSSLSLNGSGSFEVLYDENLLQQLVNVYARDIVDTLENLPSVTSQQMSATMEEIGKDFVIALIYTALYFKHPAYASEREYRFLIMAGPGNPPTGLLKRPRRNVLIDYLALDWKRLHQNGLKSIMIGPAADEKKSRKFIEDTMIQHWTGPSITVEKSPIPFRI